MVRDTSSDCFPSTSVCPIEHDLRRGIHFGDRALVFRLVTAPFLRFFPGVYVTQCHESRGGRDLYIHKGRSVGVVRLDPGLYHDSNSGFFPRTGEEPTRNLSELVVQCFVLLDCITVLLSVVSGTLFFICHSTVLSKRPGRPSPVPTSVTMVDRPREYNSLKRPRVSLSRRLKMITNSSTHLVRVKEQRFGRDVDP